MGQHHPDQPPVALFFAVMAREDADFARTEEALVHRWGPAALRSEIYDFDAFTDYYRKEFGPNQRKRLIAMEPLIPAENLPGIKIAANALEEELSGEPGARRVNIDPGYLNLSKVVLASTKDHWHRLYVAQGIFEEVTLTYRRGTATYQPLEWTYPDYRQPTLETYFCALREWYRAKLSP